MKNRESGFTLIEISIVLVIIGLLAGGILKGQQMIENAKYKQFVQQIDSYSVAVAAFQDRYHAWPGDFRKATLAFPSPPAGVVVVNGNGDGLIRTGYCDAQGKESCLAFQHLMLAGLINGNPADVGSSTGLTHTYGGPINAIVTPMASGNFNGKLTLLLMAVPGQVSQRLDEDRDDGRGLTGSVGITGVAGNVLNADGTYKPDVLYDMLVLL